MNLKSIPISSHEVLERTFSNHVPKIDVDSIFKNSFIALYKEAPSGTGLPARIVILYINLFIITVIFNVSFSSVLVIQLSQWSPTNFFLVIQNRSLDSELWSLKFLAETFFGSFFKLIRWDSSESPVIQKLDMFLFSWIWNLFTWLKLRLENVDFWPSSDLSGLVNNYDGVCFLSLRHQRHQTHKLLVRRSWTRKRPIRNRFTRSPTHAFIFTTH